MSTYLFDHAAPQASQRFASLETLYGPWTIRHLETTGIGPGWQCWEIGAGSGSIAAWLAERCGPTGHILVTDINPPFWQDSRLMPHRHFAFIPYHWQKSMAIVAYPKHGFLGQNRVCFFREML